MTPSLVEEKTKLSPDKLREQLLQELHGSASGVAVEGKDFDDLVPIKPTELAPLQEDVPVSGKRHGPLDKKAMRLQLFRESPEGQALQEDLRSLNIGPGGHNLTWEEMDAVKKEFSARKIKPYEDDTGWKNKLSNLRASLKNLASVDKTRTKLKVIADYALSATSTVSEALEVLSQAYKEGVLYPGEIQNFENLVGFHIVDTEPETLKTSKKTESKVENTEPIYEPDVVSVEPAEEPVAEKDPYETKVKLSRVIHIPKAEMKARVKVDIKDHVYSKDAEAIVSGISNKELKKSEILEKSREPLPKKVDSFFDNEKETTPEKLREMAYASFEDGEIGDALVCVDKIKDFLIQAETAGEIVERCAKRKDFETAHRFLSQIDYLDYKQKLSLWLSSIEMGQAIINNKKSKSSQVSRSESKAEVKVEDKSEMEEVASSNDEDEYDLDLNKDSTGLPDVDVIIPKDPKDFDESLILREEKKVSSEIPAKKSEKVEVKPIGVKTAEPIKVSKPVSPEVAKQKTPDSEETVDKKLEVDLGKSREEYVRQYVDWEYKTRTSKNLFARTLLDLGVTRPAPERLSLKTTALEDARDEYLKARAGVSLGMMGDVEKLLSHATEERLLVDKMKQEYREQKEREDEENGVQKEKLDKVAGIIKKGWDLWTSTTTPNQRLLISTGILSAGVLATGGLGAAAGYAGYRAARVAAGTIAGQVTGRGVDFIQKNINERRESSTKERYLSEISTENILAKEAELLEFAEKDRTRKKRQLFAKAGAMIGVGVAVGAGSGKAIDSTSEAIHSLVSGTVDNLHIPELPHAPVHKVAEVLGMKSAPDQVISVEVPVSSKGFIDTIHNIKSEIINKYGGESNVPDEIHKTFLDRSDVDLAKELHMYDPEKNLSAVLQKGDTIGLDASGNIIYNHVSGNSEIILDTQTGLAQDAKIPLHDFSQKPPIPHPIQMEEMSKVDPSDSIVVDHEVHPPVHITDENVIPVGDPADLVEKVNSASLIHEHVTFNGSPVDLVNLDNGVGRAIVYHGREIAHEYSVGDHKVFYLDDQYQDNPAFKEIRGAFNEFYLKNADPEEFVFEPVEFEGGKIYIMGDSAKPGTMHVILNGKEIGTGVVEQSGKVKMNIISNLKGGWFIADNAYERAFKISKQVVKKIPGTMLYDLLK